MGIFSVAMLLFCSWMAYVAEHPINPDFASFGDALTYCTDTPYDAGNAAFAAGSRVLMHEVWMAHHSRREAEIHSSGRDAGRVAREAGVERLVLIHLSPLGGHDELLAEAREEFPGAELSSDGFELEL